MAPRTFHQKAATKTLGNQKSLEKTKSECSLIIFDTKKNYIL